MLVPGERVLRRGCPSRSTTCLACLYWPCPCSSSNALPRTLCCYRLRLRDSCRVGGGRETTAGGRGSSKNPSNSTSSAIISHSHDFAALTDGTSHSPPRQRSRKVQDSIELVSDPQLRRNRLVRHSSTVCGGEPQNSPQSDRRYARPRKVTHTRDAIDAALRPTPPFRPAQTQRRRDHVRLRHE